MNSNQKKDYLAPKLNIFEFKLEMGFAASLQGNDGSFKANRFDDYYTFMMNGDGGSAKNESAQMDDISSPNWNDGFWN